MRASAKAGIAGMGSGTGHRSSGLIASAAFALAVIALFAITAASASAAPALFAQFGDGNFAIGKLGAGQTNIPRGIAANPDNGHVFVADMGNNRVSEFTAWGTFVKAWGWDVAPDGAPGDTPADQLEICTTTCKEGSKGGGGAGQLATPQGIALDSAGNVYAVEPNTSRVQKFSPEGQFLFSFGGDVVAHGPDDSTNDERQEVTVAAAGGTFRLGLRDPFAFDPFGSGVAAKTAPLPYNASPAEVEAALEALPTIGGLGGSVTVSGGPGGTTPYAIVFEGDLGGDNVPQLTLDTDRLAQPSGATLKCSTALSAATISYQWLRNGAPIAGATEATYTATAADEGKAIQCQVFAINANAGVTRVANPGQPAQLIAPVPATLPPVAPAIDSPAQSAPLAVGGGGGQTLTCNPPASEWQGSPSFSYKWYRNGAQIAGATGSTYVVTAGDLATAAAFQCAVTGTNAGGSITATSGQRFTTPTPDPATPSGATTQVPAIPSTVATASDGGAAEICKAAVSDTCKPGAEGTGNGQFGELAIGSYIAITPDDKVYVGDQERIQRFDTSGVYQGQVNVPGETVIALAADPLSGNLYAAYAASVNTSKPNVHKLSPAGAELGTIAVAAPTALATDPAGNLYAVDEVFEVSHEVRIRKFGPAGAEVKDKAFPFADGFDYSTGIATNPVTAAGGIDLYVANTNTNNSYIRSYGAIPDPDIVGLPPALPPAIEAQLAGSVSPADATLSAKINPKLWDDTTYYLQYGTAECAESGWTSGCTVRPALPGAPLGAGVINSGVIRSFDVEGLIPDTTYHYRFVAQSSGGGPSFGAERTFTTSRTPEPNTACPNQALRSGPAARLPDCRAYEMVSPVDKNGGDVLAYFYEGLQAALEFSGLDQSTPGGERLAYTSSATFAGALGSPSHSEYIASRTPAGWSTEPLNPPMEGGVANGVGNATSQYKAFSPDLCQGWLVSESGLPLTSPGPTEGFRNVYRRDNCVEPPAYSWLESSVPEPEPCADPECDLPYLFPDLQGASASGRCAAFRVNDALTPEAPRGVVVPANGALVAFQLYLWCDDSGLRLASVLPNGTPYEGNSSAGTETEGPLAPGSRGEGHIDTVEHALSTDGTRLYWTASSQEAPQLYLRVNADGPYSFAKGSGDLSLLATGKGNLSAGSKTVASLSTTTGAFAAGESISAGGIPAGTTIAAVSPTTLTLSAPATATGTAVALKSGSRTVANLTTSAGAFSAGQEISASGIPAGTTIAAVDNGAKTLTLSTGATTAKAAAALSATTDCTGPAMPCTLQVSGGGGLAQFWTASPDGSRAIFSVEGGFIPGLYEYAYDAAEGKGKATKIAGEDLGVAGSSEDASLVYLASREVCSSAPNGEGDLAQAGKANLYLYEAGESCAAGEMVFVGTLAEGDAPSSATLPSPIAARPRNHLARASADGEHLAFVSAAPLSAYDNADAASGEPDREVYLYDAGSGELACASCSPSGASPRGADLDSNGASPVWAAAYIPGYQHQLYGRRMLSADGNRLFFNSVDALVPQDVNDAQDVYQWETPESGDCIEASPTYSPLNQGCVALISSGESPVDSEFVDASESGDDVFIRTASSLDPRDPGLIDIYDVRVEGGFAVPTEAAACEGEACQSPPEAPNDPTPASSSFEGAGNVPAEPGPATPPRCAKGKVKRHGKCVAKKHRKRAQRHRARGADRNGRAAR